MPTSHLAQLRTTAMLLAAAAFSTGCSGDDGGPSSSPLAIAETEEASGNSQGDNVGETLGQVLRVIVTRDSQPVEGVEVQWLTTSGGSFSPGTSLTDTDGIATTTWTLGPGVGEQSASARLVGAEGSPVMFRAFAFDQPAGGGGGGPLQLRRPRVR